MKILVVALLVLGGLSRASAFDSELVSLKTASTKLVEFNVRITEDDCDQLSGPNPQTPVKRVVRYGNFVPLGYQLITWNDSPLSREPSVSLYSASDLKRDESYTNGLVLSVGFGSLLDSRILGGSNTSKACRDLVKKTNHFRVRALQID